MTSSDLVRVPGGFKLGRTYRHTSGITMRVCGSANTYLYGEALVAEDQDGKLTPVSSDESHTVNWTEVPRGD